MRLDSLTPTETALTELGRRLALTRKQQGLSQQELATAAGIGIATLRRIEGGNDSQMGSWIKVLRALGMISMIENLLAETLHSPMAEAKAARKKKRTKSSYPSKAESIWGDEAP